MSRVRSYAWPLLAAAIILAPTVVFANSDAPKCSNGHPCTTTATQGGSTNDCNGNPGCTVDVVESNKTGRNQTNNCTSPDSQCSR